MKYGFFRNMTVGTFLRNITMSAMLMGGLALATITLDSCQGGKGVVMTEQGDTITMKYAQHLKMIDHEGYTEVVLDNPWKPGAVLHRYLLVPKGKEGDEIAKTLEAKGKKGSKLMGAAANGGLGGKLMGGANGITDVVRTPIASSVVFTSPHCQLMYELGCADAITGVCDLDYCVIPDIHRRAVSKKGEKSMSGKTSPYPGIEDCGSSMQPMIEKIINIKPEALLISPFENSGGFGKLDKLHIPIIETADYMETSPLGRAEWVKFYGLLFGQKQQKGDSKKESQQQEGSYRSCKETADSLFKAVEKEYLALKQRVASRPLGRSILTERKMGNVWYVPGGKSTMGILLADARAKYIFAKDTHSGSLSLSTEQILAKAKQVDVWAFKYIGTHPLTLANLVDEYPSYWALPPMWTREIYECNTGMQPYFEQTAFHPEILLREFIQLAHPNIHLGGLKFYQQMSKEDFLTATADRTVEL